MQKFLEMCSTFGVNKVKERATRLRACCPHGLDEYFLFFTCGYDFIHAASDLKFRGIMNVFIDRNGELALNLSTDCTNAIKRSVVNPAMNTSLEGTSYADKPGKQVTFNRGHMGQQAGLRTGGVGNFNLQTKALEMTVTHPEGLNTNYAMNNVIKQYEKALDTAPATASNITLGQIARARQILAPYWNNVSSLGC
jgi:hypothetical protein